MDSPSGVNFSSDKMQTELQHAQSWHMVNSNLADCGDPVGANTFVCKVQISCQIITLGFLRSSFSHHLVDSVFLHASAKPPANPSEMAHYNREVLKSEKIAICSTPNTGGV